MLQICDIGTELLESILWHCSKESLPLLEQTCHVFVEKSQTTYPYKSIIERIIEKRIVACGEKIERPSMARLFYQREAAILKGREMSASQQLCDMKNVCSEDVLQQRLDNTLKAASTGSAIRCCFNQKVSQHGATVPNKLLNFLWVLGKKDIYAVTNSGGIPTCMNLLQSTRNREHMSVILKLLALCKDEKDHIKQIWKHNGWQLVTRILFCERDNSTKVDDLVSASALLAVFTVLIKREYIETCTVMKMCEASITEAVQLAIETIKTVMCKGTQQHRATGANLLQNEHMHLLNNLCYFIFYVLYFKIRRTGAHRCYNVCWLKNAIWSCHDFESVLWQVVQAKDAVLLYGTSLRPILQILGFFERFVFGIKLLRHPFENSTKRSRIQGLKALICSLSSSTNLTRDAADNLSDRAKQLLCAVTQKYHSGSQKDRELFVCKPGSAKRLRVR
jgi:hypothetical protein